MNTPFRIALLATLVTLGACSDPRKVESHLTGAGMADTTASASTRPNGNQPHLVDVAMRELPDFTALATVVDCLLDPIYFGGGRTSLDLFHTGAPIVTWPGPFMRSRITSGFYRRMGIDDLVAKDTSDYVEKALRVAQDGDYRRAIGSRIREASGALYETKAAVREVENFFAAAVAAAAAGSGPVDWNPSSPR